MTPLGTAANHPNYSAAKQGANLDAAFDLVNGILPDEKIHELQKKLGDKKPIIVPVHAEEAQGKNKIPIAFAAILAIRIGLLYHTDIVQINKPCRTGKGAYYRLLNYPRFDGPIDIEHDYLILDDTLTMGGTFASLRGYIESKGGRVIMARDIRVPLTSISRLKCYENFRRNMEMNLTFGGKNNLAFPSTPSPKVRLVTLPKPPVLTQSEIELLRQDLKESMAYLINKATVRNQHLSFTIVFLL